MTDVQQGRCLICHKAGPGRKTSVLCGSCADPENIVVTCDCGLRTVHEPAEGRTLAVRLRYPIPLIAGTALKLPHCAVCRAGDLPDETEIEHYQIV